MWLYRCFNQHLSDSTAVISTTTEYLCLYSFHSVIIIILLIHWDKKIHWDKCHFTKGILFSYCFTLKHQKCCLFNCHINKEVFLVFLQLVVSDQ